MSQITPYLSFIIPAYNEESRLGASLEKALDYFAREPYTVEIIVVNDGSRDATSAVARRYERSEERLSLSLIEQPRNMGKGAAVRRGMLDATGEFRIFSDADFSTPIGETAPMLRRLENGVDVCIGSRGVNKTFVKKHQPWYREFMGNRFNDVIQFAFTPGITDTQCGFKGFRAEAARRIFERSALDGFAFDVETLYLARKLGFTVEEMPVEWYNDEQTRVHFYHIFNIAKELLAIKRLHGKTPR